MCIFLYGIIKLSHIRFLPKDLITTLFLTSPRSFNMSFKRRIVQIVTNNCIRHRDWHWHVPSNNGFIHCIVNSLTMNRRKGNMDSLYKLSGSEAMFFKVLKSLCRNPPWTQHILYTRFSRSWVLSWSSSHFHGIYKLGMLEHACT